MTKQERAQLCVNLVDDWVNSLWDYCVDLGRITNATEEQVASLSPELQQEYHQIIDEIIGINFDNNMNEDRLSHIAIKAYDWVCKSGLPLEC